MDRGYVRLWRKWLDSELLGDPMAVYVWVWCLSKATHKPRKVKGIELEPGQFLTGKQYAALQLQIPPSTWYSAMKRLEKWQMVNRAVNRQGTIVTICNWGVYQKPEDDRQPPRQPHGQPNVNRTSTERQPNVDPNKNKRIKEQEEQEKEKLFVDSFGETACAKVRKWSDERRAKLRIRLADPKWVAAYPEAFAKVQTPWETEGWFPDFDWFVANDTNLFKLIEGKYDWRIKAGRANGIPRDDQRAKGRAAIEKFLTIPSEGE